MARQTRLKQWQQSSYQPYQFNNVAEFGVPESVENSYTGVSQPDFKKIANVHYAIRNQTLTQRAQVAGTSYQDSTIIVIRHNRDLASRDVIYVKLNSKLYRVINYSPNSDTYNAYDLVTLSRVKKVS